MAGHAWKGCRSQITAAVNTQLQCQGCCDNRTTYATVSQNSLLQEVIHLLRKHDFGNF